MAVTPVQVPVSTSVPTLTLAAGSAGGLAAASTIDPVNDYLSIYTASSVATQGISRNTLLGITGSPVGTNDSQTLTNKTLTNPTINAATLSGNFIGTYTLAGTPTFPASVATLTGSQTLTNKTLTSPTITSPTITNATISSDALTGFTVANSGTLLGISVAGGVVQTANSVLGAAITNSSVTSSKLNLGLQTSNNVTSATTTSGTYVTQLSDSVTNAVTVTIGTNGLALVIVSFFGFVTGNTADLYASFVASGTNTVAVSDNNAVVYGVGPSGGGSGVNAGTSKITTLTGLTPGSTTFTLQYRATGGTLTASQRSITVIPF